MAGQLRAGGILNRGIIMQTSATQKSPYNYARNEHGLAHFREIELFYFYPEQRGGHGYAYLLYDTIEQRGICWCRDEWAAHALLNGGGYVYRNPPGCWYPTK